MEPVLPLSELMMVGFQGPEPDAETWRFLAENPPGAIILFKHNITSQEQIASLIERLQSHCAAPGRPPLLIGIDQEGGRVARLGPEVGFPVIPSARTLAESADAEREVLDAVGTTARHLRRLGINMNFAPVLDVVTDPGNRVIGDRSYGSEPTVVERLGLAAIRALQENGVAATAKHFPGHGPTATDSHLDLPLIALSREELESVHLPPFRAAVAAGVAAVMTAHAVYPAFDTDAPATLSSTILNGILREQWGYDGVIVTDSLTMQAIARRQSIPEACVRALRAGADLLMVPSSPALHRTCLEGLREAVDSDPSLAGAATHSLRRSRALRAAYG